MVIIQSLRDQPSQFYRGTFFIFSKTNLVIIYRPKNKWDSNILWLKARFGLKWSSGLK